MLLRLRNALCCYTSRSIWISSSLSLDVNIYCQHWIRLPYSTWFFLLVRLPDVSDDTPETNPLLRYHDMPDFNIPPDKVITGTAKLSQDYEVALLQHLKHLQGSLQNILLWNPTCILSNCRCGLIKMNKTVFALQIDMELGHQSPDNIFSMHTSCTKWCISHSGSSANFQLLPTKIKMDNLLR